MLYLFRYHTFGSRCSGKISTLVRSMKSVKSLLYAGVGVIITSPSSHKAKAKAFRQEVTPFRMANCQ